MPPLLRGKLPLPFLMTLTTALIIFPLLAQAGGETGGGRIDSGQCPDNVEATMVYSPFKPYFKFPLFAGDRQKCWVAADCLFEAAGESRKQQFGAIALVMGLIPLTLKDIAWPERRIIPVTKKLAWPIEVLVLGLGLVPQETGESRKTERMSRDGNLIAKGAWAMHKAGVVAWIAVCTALLLACYAGLTFMEIYSKRSALGCPFPVFVAAWYVVGIVPAAIHSLFAGLRRWRAGKSKRAVVDTDSDEYSEEEGARAQVGKMAASAEARETRQASDVDPERQKKIVSAVQGADEDWPVQLSWGIYYIAGTLIFTSIMAVTVVELICWVALGFAVTGSSKLLAFFLCLAFEETGRRLA